MSQPKHLAGWGRTTFAWMAAITTLLWVTGWVMYWLPASELMDMSDIQATLRRVSGVTHGVITWAFCVMCGRGVWPHVRMMWHKKPCKISAIQQVRETKPWNKLMPS
mgnify:CR=1 FL=1